MEIQSTRGFGGSMLPPIKLKSLEVFRNDLNDEWLKADKDIGELNDDWFYEVSAAGINFEDTKIVILNEYNSEDHDDDYPYSPAA